MNTLDSQHLDYNENDFLESNPFADTPSKSTELSQSIIHKEEEHVEQEREMTPEQELVSEEEEEEEMINTHEGEQVTSPISTVHQLEELSIEPEVETDTQVSR